MIKPEHYLPVVRQCKLLGPARSMAHYRPEPTSEADPVLMRRIDALRVKWPFLDARHLRASSPPSINRMSHFGL